MDKVELLNRIQKLSDVVHSKDFCSYQLSENVAKEMQQVLDKLTEQYIEKYCA